MDFFYEYATGSAGSSWVDADIAESVMPCSEYCDA